MDAASPDLASLMRHAGFVRALARSLVRSRHDAEDIEQEAWLAALRSPPSDASAAKSWLARVVRNFAGMHARVDMHRDQRERAVARAERIESQERSIEQLELHEQLVRAVLELREPYRGAVVACYFDGLSARDAARRLDVPLETLRTRLKRALAMLRDSLDREHGDRSTWMALALPIAGIARDPVAAGATVLGGIMGVKIGVAATVMALAAGWWWIRADRVETRPTLGAVEFERASDTLERESSPPALVDSTERAEAPDEVAHTSATKRSNLPPAPASELFGDIVVIDELGAEHAQENGLIQIVAAGGNYVGRFRTTVDGGRFAFTDATDQLAEALRGQTPAQLNIVLGGRAAFVVDPPPLVRGVPLHLRAQWIERALLSVVDASNGVELTDVTALHKLIAWRGQIHPGEWTAANQWVRGVPSPIELPPVDGTATYWVCAPGYAWKSIEVDHRSGGVRRVALERGASITITTKPPAPGLALRVRLFATDYEGGPSGQADVAARDDGPIELEGLAPGAYQIRAEVGMWYEHPRVFGKADVTLRAGASEHVDLALDLGDLATSTVPLAGTLSLPRDLHGASVRLRYSPLPGPPLRPDDEGSLALDDMQALDAGRFAWRAPNVTPGSYVVIIDPFQWWQRVEVRPGGVTDVDVTLPELARVVVRVVEQGSLTPIDKPQLTWSRAMPEQRSMWRLDSVDFDDAASAYVLAVPPGRIVVDIDDPDHERAWRELDVPPLGAELELQVRPLPSFQLGLLDGATRVPLGWGIHVEVEPLQADSADNNGNAVERRDAPLPFAKFVVRKPGLYRVRIPPIEGFVQPEELTVQVDFGAPQIVDVALRRR